LGLAAANLFQNPDSFSLITKRRPIMKRMAHQFTNPRALIISAVAFFFTIAFAMSNPSLAVSADPAQKTSGKVSKVDRTEARIKDLQAKLKITPAQEELWKKVTEVMRDNAKTMDTLIQARSEKTKTINTVEDLKSYSEIIQAHADGLKNFIPVFEALYVSMSDDQKKEADTLFRYGGHHRKAKGKSQ
jgi:protein CpxP